MHGGGGEALQHALGAASEDLTPEALRPEEGSARGQASCPLQGTKAACPGLGLGGLLEGGQWDLSAGGRPSPLQPSGQVWASVAS